MKKKKVIAFFSIAILFLILFINVYLEAKAIKNAKVEIYDVKVDRFFPNIVLNISIKIYNNESKKIRDLKGDFDIYILNVSTGKMYFEKINIPPHSYNSISMPLLLYYEQIARSIVEAIKKFTFSVSIKGRVEGKIFFGLIKYEKPVEATWKIVS